MTDSDKIAAFLAAKGPTRIAPEARSYTPRELKELVRGERQSEARRRA